MRGYEISVKRAPAGWEKFRIPMRGYERWRPAALVSYVWVPNPHEGL